MFRFFILILVFQSKIITLEVNSFSERLTSDSILIDVRTPEEFKDGHIKGAINISVTSDDFGGIINNFPKDQPIYVYCRSVKRSSRAANQMKAMNFRRIIELDGGYLAWMKSKKFTE